MSRSNRFFFNRCLVLASLLLAGCGGDTIKVAPVEGTVTAGGLPLDKIMVEFWPEASGTRSFGETDSQGHFKLMTDDGKREGASIGSHKVILKDSGILGDKFMGRKGETVDLTQGKKPRIAGKYSAPESTTIVKTVEAGKKNDFAIEVTK